MLDARRHPHLWAYLDGLPAGLASHPECQSKGTLLSSAAFRGLIELTGGRNVKCSMASDTDTSATYAVSWE